MRDKPVFCGTWSLLWVRNHFLRKSETFFRRLGFNPWVRKISWRRKWQPTLIFLPGKSHGERSLMGYIHWVAKSWTHDLVTEIKCPSVGSRSRQVTWSPRAWAGSSNKVSTVPLSHHTTGEQDIKKVQGLALGFPGGANGKEPACQCRRHKGCEFDPLVRKILWRRAWQPTPFLLGESHGQRNLVGYSPWGRKVLDMTEATEHVWSTGSSPGPGT